MENPSSESVGSKIWWKRWGTVLILAAVAAFVVWALIQAGPWLRSWQERRAADALRRQAEEQLRNDKYGGKTPEETFDMFIAALEKSDVELASKYFVHSKQDNWLKTLSQYQEKSLLLDFVSELKNSRKNWEISTRTESDRAEFYYKVIVENDTVANLNGRKIPLESGEYSNTIRFEKYPNNIWKIAVL